MNARAHYRFLLSWPFILTTAVALAQTNSSKTPPGPKLDQQFQLALTDYQQGKPAEAASLLEALLPKLPKSFEVHELLGLVYAGEKQNKQAIEQLTTAVRLRPDDAAARTNLGTALSLAGETKMAGDEFRKALALEPEVYDANHNLAEYYLQSKDIIDALPLLQHAQSIKPAAYDNGYDLALAYFLSGRSSDAAQLAQALLAQQNTGELHNLLGQIDEKDSKFVEAANEFETAARMDPTEDNLFVFASELLLHRNYEQAIDIFQRASKRYPASPRLLIGLGMAEYSRGMYRESIQALLTASDITPADARCYLFLSKAYLSAPDQADEVIRRFRRYAELQPNNALAQYYLAMSLWKGKRSEDMNVDLNRVESLLLKSIRLDGNLAEPRLQLGILYASQHQYDKSFPQYSRALELDPDSPDVHFRLGEYYVHAGKKDLAKEQFAAYERLHAIHQAEVDKERAEVKQFVVSAQAAPSNNP